MLFFSIVQRITSSIEYGSPDHELHFLPLGHSLLHWTLLVSMQNEINKFIQMEQKWHWTTKFANET